MFKFELPHFVTGPFEPARTFLADEEYGRALDCLVKACTDVLIIDGNGEDCKILLGKRIVEPQPDWWFTGGRMKPGETPERSVFRLMKRELGVEIQSSQLRLLGCHSYAWARRQQEPMDNGTCDISLVFTLVLDKSFTDTFKFDPKEYSDLKWFGVDEILNGDHFHPALRSSARDLKARLAWDTLTSISNSSPSDANAIAIAAKKLIAYKQM